MFLDCYLLLLDIELEPHENTSYYIISGNLSLVAQIITYRDYNLCRVIHKCIPIF